MFANLGEMRMATRICTRGKRRRGGGVATIVNLFVGFSIFFLLIGSSGVHAFFIDFESLGFSTSKSDEGVEDSSGSGSSQLQVAAPPSEQDEVVEVESKEDPNKSIKLTLGELKQLVLGTVKDLTPSPQPINIRITSSNHPKTTTTPPPGKPINKYKDSMLQAFMKSREPEVEEDENGARNRPAHGSYSLPLFDDENEQHDSKMNDIAEAMDYRPSDGQGWFSATKAALKAPNHLVNSYTKSLSKWRSRGKPKKQSQRQQVLADITYPDEPRRRRKRPPPRRRPSRRRNHYRRPGGYTKQNQRLPAYYDDEYGDTEYYDDRRRGGHRQRYSGDGGGRFEYMERADHLTYPKFDSNFPRDDAPSDMRAPVDPIPSMSFYL